MGIDFILSCRCVHVGLEMTPLVLLTRLTARVVIMINALSWSGKDHRSDLLSCKTKDYKTGICSFFSIHAVIMSKTTHSGLEYE